MNVVGVDLSLTRTGICYSDGVVATIASKHHGVERLCDLRRQIVDNITFDGRPDLVVIEGYSMGTARQQSHAHALGELGGVIRVALHVEAIPSVDVPPAVLKKFAVGKGNAPKDAVFAAAVRAGFPGDDNNEADAWWLREIGLFHSGLSTVNFTEYRVEAVGKIDWPAIGERVA